MKFTINCASGAELTGDTKLGQKFEIRENGVLAFFDAPEGPDQHVTAFAPAAWVSVGYATRSSG